HEIRGRHRAEAFATREHEVDEHDLACHQVVVEPDRLVVVSRQDDIGKVALCPRRGRLQADKRSQDARDEDRGEKQHAAQLASIHVLRGRMSILDIMRMSSCSMLWHWKTNGPRESMELVKMSSMR